MNVLNLETARDYVAKQMVGTGAEITGAAAMTEGRLSFVRVDGTYTDEDGARRVMCWDVWLESFGLYGEW